jgi:hypothetical protein
MINSGRRNWILVGMIALGMSAVCVAPARAAEEKKSGKETAAKKERKESDEGQQNKVSLDKVPAAVRKTFKREANGAGIGSVDVEKRDGKTVYETDVEIDGQNYEILVGADGKLISKMVDSGAEEKEGKSGKSAKDDSKGGDKKVAKAKKETTEEAEDDDDKPVKVKVKAKKETKEVKSKKDKGEKEDKKEEKEGKGEKEDEK